VQKKPFTLMKKRFVSEYFQYLSWDQAATLRPKGRKASEVFFQSFYITHDNINPTRIVPLGPDQDLNAPHGCDHLE